MRFSLFFKKANKEQVLAVAVAKTQRVNIHINGLNIILFFYTFINLNVEKGDFI